MKKTKIVLLCWILVIMTVFSACGGKKSNSGSGDKVVVSEDNTMPIVKEGDVTLNVAAYDNYYAAASYKSNLPIWKEIEEITGVKINWEVVPSSQYHNTMTIRLASKGDLPDLFTIPGVDPVKYGTSGVVEPLNDWIDKYAPNTKKFLDENPNIKSLLTAPDGNIYRLASASSGNSMTSPMSWLIRQDWLDKLNLKAPTNLDEWYEVLKAFKEKDPNGNGKADEIPMVFTHYSTPNTFGNAFGLHLYVSEGFWPDENGQIRYEWQDDRAKEMLLWLRKLYAEGLIDPDYLSTGSDQYKTKVTKNIVGATFNYLSGMDAGNTMLETAGVTDANWVAVNPPEGPDGYKGHIETSPPTSGFFGMSATSKQKEIAMKWLDFVYASDEGTRLTLFGIEGKSYEMVDGKPQFTEWALNNPDGLDLESALRTLGALPTIPYLKPGEGPNSGYADAALANNPKRREAIAQVKPYIIDCYPRSLILVTADESAALSSLSADLDATVQEWVAKFITGTEDINEKWSAFQKDLKRVGIDELLKIEQQKYERYSK